MTLIGSRVSGKCRSVVNATSESDHVLHCKFHLRICFIVMVVVTKVPSPQSPWMVVRFHTLDLHDKSSRMYSTWPTCFGSCSSGSSGPHFLRERC